MSQDTNTNTRLFSIYYVLLERMHLTAFDSSPAPFDFSVSDLKCLCSILQASSSPLFPVSMQS